MSLLTDYDLPIPEDSTVSIRTAGILGETYLAIDVQKAVGPRTREGGVLKAVEAPEANATDLLQRMTDALGKCDPLVGSAKQQATAGSEAKRH